MTDELALQLILTNLSYFGLAVFAIISAVIILAVAYLVFLFGYRKIKLFLTILNNPY